MIQTNEAQHEAVMQAEDVAGRVKARTQAALDVGTPVRSIESDDQGMRTPSRMGIGRLVQCNSGATR